MTDLELATRLHRDLSALATEAGWSVAATPDQALGSYTDPIADAKTQLGMSDLSLATNQQLRQLRRLALAACLDRLDTYYATLVDIRVGERDEKLSQLRASLPQLRASLIGRVAIGMRLPSRTYPDYDPASGDAADA